MKKTKIVFVGCGYVSVWAYKKLYKSFKKQIHNKDVEVTLLSLTSHHDFHGFTGEFINGFLPLQFKSTSKDTLFKGASFIQGKLVGVRPDLNLVEYETADGELNTLGYDQLVIGAGSHDNFIQIKGAKEHAYSVKENNGIQSLREKIIDCLIEAERETNEEKRNQLLSFTVIGAGFAGAEVSGNLVETLDLLKPQFSVLQKYNYAVNLVYDTKDILPQLESSKFLFKYSKNIIKKLKINLYPNVRVSEITADKVILSNGEIIHSSTVVCTAGQRNQHFAKESELNADTSARLLVDSNLRSVNHANIWSGGDAAQVKRPYFDEACKHDALWAIKHGSRIGKNLVRTLKGRKPVSFKYPGLGQTASFYKNKAILELYGFPIFGPIAWLTRIGFFLYFMPSRKTALKAIQSITFDKKQQNETWSTMVRDRKSLTANTKAEELVSS